jgi:hypothetical protein
MTHHRVSRRQPEPLASLLVGIGGRRRFSFRLRCDYLMSMQGAVTAVIAIAGTLLGSATTYLFQRMNAQRAEIFSFQQQLRSERMIVYSDFAKAVKDYQRAQDSWWFRNREGPESKDAYDAIVQALDLGSSVQHALFRVELVTDSSELIEKARHAYRLANKLREAATKADLGLREDVAEGALGDFIALAKRDIQQRPGAEPIKS